MPFTPSRLTALLLVAGVAAAEVGLLDVAVRSGSRAALAQGAISLYVRRGPAGVELVIQGVGPQPVLQQRFNGGVWQGSLQTQGEPGILNGIQQVSDPVAGLQRASITGSGNNYLLEVFTRPGQSLREPVVSADGRNLILGFPGLTAGPSLQTGRIDLNTPGRVAQTRYAPPLRPRAVAPPLGDMAIGTMVLQNRSSLSISGPPVTLALNNASAKDALTALARLGGYGFVYVPNPKSTNKSEKNRGQSAQDLPNYLPEPIPQVSVFFEDEPYSSAMNSLLISSGMEARLKGNTLYIGKSLSKITFGNYISKVIRLNQVKSDAAAEYLSTLGAEFCNTILPGKYESQIESEYSYGTEFDAQDISGSVKGSGNSDSKTAGDFTPGEAEIKCYGKEDASGPLYGISGTSDKRLNTITLIGEPRVVSVAQQYLKTLDLRKRQVAIRVQILNIDLRNNKDIDSSFSARIGNTFLVSESGRAFMNFGDFKPGSSAGTGVYGSGAQYAQPGTYPGSSVYVPQQEVRQPFIPRKTGEVVEVLKDGEFTGSEVVYVDKINEDGVKEYVPDPNPNASQQLVPVYDDLGRPVYVASSNPVDGPEAGFNYARNSFYGYLEAMIESRSVKVLASPTLIVQEGSGAKVETGTSVITDAFETIANNQTNISTKRETAGLLLNVDVERIDDNGFISLSIDPTISVPVPSASSVGNVKLFDITRRKLNSGLIRLRDRQTLVLTGVIQDSDRELVTKWPVLGDLPFVGQLFRGSNSEREKNELVVLVTPYVLDDSSGGVHGYGYRPSTQDSRQLLQLQ